MSAYRTIGRAAPTDAELEALGLRSVSGSTCGWTLLSPRWQSCYPPDNARLRQALYIVTCEALHGSPSPAEMISRLETAGHVVELVQAWARTTSEPLVDYRHGFVGVRQGMILSTVEILTVQISDDPALTGVSP